MNNETLTELYQRLVIDTKGMDHHETSKNLYFDIKRLMVKSSDYHRTHKNRGLEELAKRESQLP